MGPGPALRAPSAVDPASGLAIMVCCDLTWPVASKPGLLVFSQQTPRGQITTSWSSGTETLLGVLYNDVWLTRKPTGVE